MIFQERIVEVGATYRSNVFPHQKSWILSLPAHTLIIFDIVFNDDTLKIIKIFTFLDFCDDFWFIK